jgi:hypothetical protein
MINSFQYIPSNNADTNYKLFNYLVTPKYISITKAGIDLALTGHPIEAFTLTRLLFEISQVTQCLTFHPEYIKRYNEGKLKPENIRKILSKTSKSNSGGKLFGLLSNYSHSTRELLFTTLNITESASNVPIISEKFDVIEKAIFGIVYNTWVQYFMYRGVFKEDKISDIDLCKWDKEIFNVEHMKKLFGNNYVKIFEEVSSFINYLDNK